jgi:hypothetical protein
MGMTDPGGGHGWRSARHLPDPYGRVAERAERMGEQRPLCVLLLPEEPVPWAEPLAAAPGVVVVEPARLSYRSAARLPDAFADGLAVVQARRMRVPGVPRAIVLFHPLGYRLARALLGLYPDAELWYGGGGEGPLHDLAEGRADLRFTPGGDHRPLWERMERLGIESGRLGSERL